jgi:hypothetical protein
MALATAGSTETVTLATEPEEDVHGVEDVELDTVLASPAVVTLLW